MAKYHGLIGYSKTEETEPGIWEELIIEQPYYGDILKSNSKYQSSNNVNDNITISNNISIVADPYAIENFQHIRYAVFMGIKWNITNVEVEYPRIILTLGGKYNENKNRSSD